MEPSKADEWTRLTVEHDWRELVGAHHPQLESALVPFIKDKRWFGGKGKQLSRINLVDAHPLDLTKPDCYLLTIEVEYATASSERYVVPLALATGLHSESIFKRNPELIIGEVKTRTGEQLGLLHDASLDRELVIRLCNMMNLNAKIDVNGCRISAESFERIQLQNEGERIEDLLISSLGVQQSNTSVRVGTNYVLKLLRRLEDGINPDLELGRYLTTVAHFSHVPATAGDVTLKCGRTREPATVAILQRFVENVGDAWAYTQRELARYYRAALTEDAQLLEAQPRPELLGFNGKHPEPHLRVLIGPYYDAVRIIGQRTAQMHACLAAATDNPSLVLEPFTTHYQRQLYQGFRSLTSRTIDRLGENLSGMPSNLHPRVQDLIGREAEIMRHFEVIRDSAISASRIRIHGDYHLGQLLCTGNDFVVVDFEGEPLRAVSERRIKRCPLRDVAGMLRSFHYAAMHSLIHEMPGAVVRPSDRQVLLPWADLWLSWVSSSFLEGYLAQSRDAIYLPTDPNTVATLLVIYLLEKALYEINYELAHRPDWVGIPLDACERLLGTATQQKPSP